MTAVESFPLASGESPEQLAREEFRAAIGEVEQKGGETVERLVAGVRERVGELPRAAGAVLGQKAEDMEEQLKGIDHVEHLVGAAGVYKPDQDVTAVGTDELLAAYGGTQSPEIPLAQVVAHEKNHKDRHDGKGSLKTSGEVAGVMSDDGEQAVTVLGWIPLSRREIEEYLAVKHTGDVPAYEQLVQKVDRALRVGQVTASELEKARMKHDMTDLNKRVLSVAA